MNKRCTGIFESSASKPSMSLDRIDWVGSQLSFGILSDDERSTLSLRFQRLKTLGLQAGTNDCLSSQHPESCRYAPGSGRRGYNKTPRAPKTPKAVVANSMSGSFTGTVYKVKGRSFGRSGAVWLCVDRDGTTLAVYVKGSDARSYLESL